MLIGANGAGKSNFVAFFRLLLEGLLFSNPQAFAAAIGKPHLAGDSARIRGEFAPRRTSTMILIRPPPNAWLKPIRRIAKCWMERGAARAVGIDSMKQECPHFREWMEQLQAPPLLNRVLP